MSKGTVFNAAMQPTVKRLSDEEIRNAILQQDEYIKFLDGLNIKRIEINEKKKVVNEKKK